ncbi:hypothetical protein PF001_g27866, partial [Phytophthora fragariae]
MLGGKPLFSFLLLFLVLLRPQGTEHA